MKSTINNQRSFITKLVALELNQNLIQNKHFRRLEHFRIDFILNLLSKSIKHTTTLILIQFPEHNQI